MDVLKDLEDAADGHGHISMSKRAISRIGTIGMQFDDQRDKFGNVIDGGTVHYRKWTVIENSAVWSSLYDLLIKFPSKIMVIFHELTDLLIYEYFSQRFHWTSIISWLTYK